jgi:hypothetical protein
MHAGRIAMVFVCIACIGLPLVVIKLEPNRTGDAWSQVDLKAAPLLLVVLPGPSSGGGVNFGMNIPYSLTIDDAEAIQKDCPAVADVAPIVRVRTKAMHKGQAWVPLYIYGTTSQFLNVRGRQNLAEGRAFSNDESLRAMITCIIGQTIVKELFEGQIALGQEIEVKGVAQRIVGILHSAGIDDFLMDQDDIVLMPLGTAIEYFRQSLKAPDQGPVIDNSISIKAGTLVEHIQIRVDSIGQIEVAKMKITELLRPRHNIPKDAQNDFNIRDLHEMAMALRIR